MSKIILPEPLKSGDAIAIISPAGSVDPVQLEQGLQMIRNRGYKPVLGEHVYSRFSNGYSYAGTEKERLKDLNNALNDPDIKAVWASRGGYGCQHLLRKLKTKSFKNHPKWYIGYSDNTVIQSYLMKKGYASVHGQTVKTSSFGVTEESYERIFGILAGNLPGYTLLPHSLNRAGEAEGKLIGGNLALVYALLGTKYSFDFKDHVLFIEDIGENFYALDRMIMSLELAGVFKKIKGLIIGGMTNMGEEKDNAEYNESFDGLAYRIISEKISGYKFPVAFGFPNGHIRDNRPLIIGGHLSLKVGETVSLHFRD
ncbi:LD-carboxypeptidase [uncultured Chryseobacterium sp.]|uniref:S66 peptidase family protein n=1 Tax=uncultured Chryseobacterium sp. TaxID=259322 RepID=UPI0025CE5492|nr:LD-carboxypeptidase [uncultured Chryseobacterium sp.]